MSARFSIPALSSGPTWGLCHFPNWTFVQKAAGASFYSSESLAVQLQGSVEFNVLQIEIQVDLTQRIRRKLRLPGPFSRSTLLTFSHWWLKAAALLPLTKSQELKRAPGVNYWHPTFSGKPLASSSSALCKTPQTLLWKAAPSRSICSLKLIRK